MQNRIKYLQKKIPETIDVEVKYRNKFDKQARYLGNGTYHWNGVYSTDTRELFLMGVLVAEGIKFKQI